MNAPTTDRIKQVLTSEAAVLTPRDNLAETVIKRGRMLRRVRTTAAAVFIAAGVVAAIAVPVGSLRQSIEPQPAGVIRDGELVTVHNGESRLPNADFDTWYAGLNKGAAARLPYAEGDYLVDGGTRLRMPGQSSAPLGRVVGGWLLLARNTASAKLSYGVLGTKGDYRLLAQGRLLGAAVSPDRTQVAYATADPHPTVLVVDVASGKTVTSTPFPGDGTETEGVRYWNSSGIWLETQQGSVRWTPGSPPAANLGRTVRARAQESDLLQEHIGECDRLLSPDGTARIEYCGSTASGTLSPRGTTFVTADGRAHGVYQPRDTQLQLIGGIGLDTAVWEDERYVLVVSHRDRIQLIRCDVTTGDCESVPTAGQITNPPIN